METALKNSRIWMDAERNFGSEDTSLVYKSIARGLYKIFFLTLMSAPSIKYKVWSNVHFLLFFLIILNQSENWKGANGQSAILAPNELCPQSKNKGMRQDRMCAWWMQIVCPQRRNAQLKDRKHVSFFCFHTNKYHKGFLSFGMLTSSPSGNLRKYSILIR